MATWVCAALFCLAIAGTGGNVETLKPKATVGVYYFDGWSGRSRFAETTDSTWAKMAPTHLTKRMLDEVPEREPVWGWRDDSLEVMERQINLAADHGIAFFAFCWYWHDNGGAINEKAILEDPLNTGLNLFLKARNNHRMKFCLLVANHGGYQIKGAANWKSAGEFWLRYFTHKQYLTTDGRPLLIVFNSSGGDREGFAAMQETVRRAGLPGLAIAGCGDAQVETGYTHRTHYAVIPGYSGGSEQHTYAELAAATRARWSGTPRQPYIPLVMSGWDKRPWEGPRGLNQSPGWFFPDRTSEQFADLLHQAVMWMNEH
ncbi:MAG: glycoside hydrolase family 99-like domain-containing protein, partial [Kiritimatiellia bacterium]